jgi:hypothetical protein
MMKKFKRLTASVLALLVAASASGCGKMETYDDFTFPEAVESNISPVSNTNVDEPKTYEDDGIGDEVLAEFSSDDGACVVKKMEHYYDVTLDYENHSPEEVGKAYAETVMEAYPEVHEVLEPYIYENIYWGFPALVDDFDPVWERVSYLAKTVEEDEKLSDYWKELDAFAEAISGGEHGYAEDGHISYEEAVTFSFIPEALRGTACSALSLWGSKSETGDRVTVRLLDWNLGTEYQMCRVHSVIHAKKGDRSYTGISFFGFESIISAINDDGVFAGILDVGTLNEKYIYEDRRCYTYDLRYALEEFDTAKEVGDYMVGNSADYTWCHNLIISDKDSSYCAEDAVDQVQKDGIGYSILRDSESPLIKGLTWNNPDSLCVVNSFATEGNQDMFYFDGNAVRWNKYDEWVGSKDKFTVGELKTVLTQEKVKQGQAKDEAKVNNVRSTGTAQMIIVDYHTGKVQVAFTPETGPTDDVVFTDIGHY